MLKDGKIVLEKYFGSFTQDSIWYWASAGKTLTAFLTGIAQNQGALNISQSVTQHLGSGWSSCNMVQEDSITIKHLLTMTSGLDDIISTCSNEDDSPPCLQYHSPVGIRWAYHTGAYRKLQDILPIAVNTSLNTFTNNSIKNRINMSSGVWIQDIYFSKTRDAARFGLLCLNKGIWNTDTILNDTNYFQSMINSSQSQNLSYGYLTWLNGKPNFMLPSSQLVFNGFICPSAPADMYAALGKNDQKIYIVPSQKLVVVRFGNEAYSSSLAVTVFDDELWQKINDLNCTVTSKNYLAEKNYQVWPNPFYDNIHVLPAKTNIHFVLTNISGQLVYEGKDINQQNFKSLPQGIYLLKLIEFNQVSFVKLIKN
ncbi:MAG TPA: serine hydrolase [Bacteroidia bacterium]|nr:serine hydrolase [Bacteroidia bacterium]